VRLGAGRLAADRRLRESGRPPAPRREPVRRDGRERPAAARHAGAERSRPARAMRARDLGRARRRGAVLPDRDAVDVRDGIARDLDKRPDARARDEQPLMRPRRLFMHRILIAAVVAVLAGCASAPHEPAEDPRYEPASPAARAPAAAPGTIYRGGGLHLFMDLRA